MLLRRQLALAPIGAGLIAIALLALLVRVLSPVWPPTAACTSGACVEGREWFSLSITLIVIVGGLYQYWRGQHWKRAEFLAAEMRDFLDAKRVRNTLLMIDWSARRIDLGSDEIGTGQWEIVTRKEQSRALLPHTIPLTPVAGEGREEDAGGRIYTRKEAAIRDCFDAFLDGLERFASYVDTGLVRVDDLRPYLGYWIHDIARPTDDRTEGEWTCCLLSFIDFYGYPGVQRLFAAFGYDIHPRGKLYQSFLKSLEAVPPPVLEAEILKQHEN